MISTKRVFWNMPLQVYNRSTDFNNQFKMFRIIDLFGANHAFESLLLLRFEKMRQEPKVLEKAILHRMRRDKMDHLKIIRTMNSYRLHRTFDSFRPFFEKIRRKPNV